MKAYSETARIKTCSSVRNVYSHVGNTADFWFKNGIIFQIYLHKRVIKFYYQKILLKSKTFDLSKENGTYFHKSKGWVLAGNLCLERVKACGIIVPFEKILITFEFQGVKSSYFCWRNTLFLISHSNSCLQYSPQWLQLSFGYTKPELLLGFQIQVGKQWYDGHNLPPGCYSLQIYSI